MSTKFGSSNTASLLDLNELKNLYSIQNAITRVVNFFVSICLFEAYFYCYFEFST